MTAEELIFLLEQVLHQIRGTANQGSEMESFIDTLRVDGFEDAVRTAKTIVAATEGAP